VDTKEKLSGVTIALHWIVAAGMIALLAMGMYMADFEVGALFPLHKALGVIFFLVIMARVFWRVKTGWPATVREYPTWEHKLAVLTHWVLIIGTVLMPLSGFIFSGASGHGVDVFGLVLAPTNPDPADPTKVIAFNGPVAHLGHEAHEILGNIMVAAIALHIVGAYKHHFLDKDRTMLRMLGK